MSTAKIDSATLRRIAVEADVDPRSVRREILEPGSVRGMSGQRIRDALRTRKRNARQKATTAA